MKRNQQIRNMTLFAMFLAIEMVLSLTPLGFIRTGFLSITLLHIPVIAAGILMGPSYGAALGLVFGLLSIWNNTMTPSLTSFVFSPFITVGGISGNWTSLIIALVPRVLLGYLSGIFFRFFSKVLPHKKNNRSLVAFVSAVSVTFLHSVMVLSLIAFFWGPQYAQATTKTPAIPGSVRIILTEEGKKKYTGVEDNYEVAISLKAPINLTGYTLTSATGDTVEVTEAQNTKDTFPIISLALKSKDAKKEAIVLNPIDFMVSDFTAATKDTPGKVSVVLTEEGKKKYTDAKDPYEIAISLDLAKDSQEATVDLTGYTLEGATGDTVEITEDQNTKDTFPIAYLILKSENADQEAILLNGTDFEIDDFTPATSAIHLSPDELIPYLALVILTNGIAEMLVAGFICAGLAKAIKQ